MLTYNETIEHLFEQLPMFQRVGAPAFKKDLTNTYALCAMLGDPQKKLKSVHVAGTNGKGSVSHLIAAMLQASGKKVGLYTSPHYKDFRERMKINGEFIAKEKVVEFVRNYREEYMKIKPSFFELTVAMAFDFFAKEKVDFAVIETGMGGRFDSTNVITPLLSVITNIGFDHMQFLGNTLPAIAFEKAGIIKNGVPVVIGETDYETAPVFLQMAEEKNAHLDFADQCVRVMLNEKRFDKMVVDVYEHEKLKLQNVEVGLSGNFQLKNFVTAWYSARLLRMAGIELTDEEMMNGMKHIRKLTNIFGRWQFLSTNGPLVVCDSGHNAHGLRESLRELLELKARKLHMVLGFVKDKDLNAVLPLFPSDAKYYFCRPDLPRGLDEHELKNTATFFGLEGFAYSSVKQAYNDALINAGKEDVVFIGGSTFVVAEVL